MSKDRNIQDELSSSMTGGRLRRYAKVTTAMGGLAARLAGERYLGIKINRQQHASDLRAALGGLKGPLMKVAQILATIPDALPKEYVIVKPVLFNLLISFKFLLASISD